MTENNWLRRPIKRLALRSGDRLEKVGSPGRVWVVAHLVTSADQQPHAVIAYENNNGETRMLAQSVLCDETRYRRLRDS
jgi:hypothetical protein